jgi:uncharacterized alkaline shock family protein YloU
MVMFSLVMTASIVAQGTPGRRVRSRSCARSIGERLAQWQTAAGVGAPRASRRRYTRATSDERDGVRERPGPSFSAEVITSTVWDAIKGIPGVADLYRNPLQTLGERVHMERHGPVRLGEDDAGPVLEVHLVVDPGAGIPAVCEAVARAGATYLERTTGTPITHVEVHVDDVAAVDDE